MNARLVCASRCETTFFLASFALSSSLMKLALSGPSCTGM